MLYTVILQSLFLYQKSHSFGCVNNSCINTIRLHFPWSISLHYFNQLESSAYSAFCSTDSQSFNEKRFSRSVFLIKKWKGSLKLEWNSFVCFTVGEENCREPIKQQQFHQKYSIHVKLMPNNGQQLRSARDKVGLFWWAVQKLGQILHVFVKKHLNYCLKTKKEQQEYNSTNDICYLEMQNYTSLYIMNLLSKRQMKMKTCFRLFFFIVIIIFFIIIYFFNWGQFWMNNKRIIGFSFCKM